MIAEWAGDYRVFGQLDNTNCSTQKAGTILTQYDQQFRVLRAMAGY